MKDSKTLLLTYLASIRDPERAAALFAEDGVFELPYLRSLGVGPRYVGRREITALLSVAQALPQFRVRPGRYSYPHRDAGQDLRRVRGACARRSDRANAPSAVHRLPGRRGRPDQVDTRNAEPTGDGSGPIGEWSRRDRTTRQRGALFLTWCEQVAYADHGSLGQSRPYNLSGTST